MLRPLQNLGPGAETLVGVTEAELRDYMIDVVLTPSVQELTPVNLTWGMGCAWSPLVAQSYMVNCCKEAGFLEDQFLTEEGTLPATGVAAVSVATDDVLHFHRASANEVDNPKEPPLVCLDRVWACRGLKPNEG